METRTDLQEISSFCDSQIEAVKAETIKLKSEIEASKGTMDYLLDVIEWNNGMINALGRVKRQVKILEEVKQCE